MSARVYPTESGTFRVKWRENGRQKSETVKTQKEADALKEAIERRLGVGKSVMRPQDVPTFEEFAIEFLARRRDLAESTRRLYAELLTVHVNPVLGHLPLIELRPRRLAEWQEQRLQEGAGPAVLGKAQTLMRQILDKAVLPHEYLDQNPVLALDKPTYRKKPQRWLSAGEVEMLRTWFLERDDIGSATLISILAYVGIRPQDALARRWSNLTGGPPRWVRLPGNGAGSLFVDSKNTDGKIVPGSKTDEDAKRTVYVPEPVLGDLGVWQPVSPGGGLAFPRTDCEPWTKTDWNNWCSRHPKGKKNLRPRCFRAASEAVGLGTNLTPYHLRHTAATLYASAGWDHREIARQLGHTPTTSTGIYQHLLDERPREGAQFSVEDFIREARGFAPARETTTKAEEAAGGSKVR